MPPLKSWPEWIKAALTAALGGAVALWGMALSEGGRRADADATARMTRDHEPRIQSLERDRAAVDEWKAGIKAALDDLKVDAREIKTELRALRK